MHAAEYEVAEALRLDPGSTFASLTLARVLTLRNRWSEALRLCSEVLAADPTDVDAIADAMLRLSQEETLRQQLVAAGYANLQRFSWEKAARQTLAVLCEAANEPPP